MTLFFFPFAVSDTMSRFIGAQVVVISILAIVFRGERPMHWAMAGLALDYALRFVYGGNPSALYPLAMLGTRWLPPRFVPGAQKQFASFVGCVFATISALLFLLASSTGGAVVAAMLGTAAFLEAAFGFCLACFMMSMGIRFGLLPTWLMEQSEEITPEMEELWNYTYVNQWDDTPPKKEKYSAKGKDGPETPIDLKYKTTSDDWEFFNSNTLQHFSQGDFAIALGTSGLALVWKVATPLLYTSDEIWIAIAIASAIVFGISIVLCVLWIILHPSKFINELQHPVTAPLVGVFLTTILVFSALTIEFDNEFGKVLLWLSCPLQWACMVIFLGVLIVRPHYKDYVNGNWMMMFAGPLVAASAGSWNPLVDFREAGFFFLGFPILLTYVLFCMVIYRMTVESEPEPRHKPALWSVLAGLFFVNIAYVAVTGHYDSFAKISYFIGIGFLATLLSMCLFNNYFGNHPFHRGVWPAAFALDTAAIASLKYYERNHRGDAEKFLVYSTLILACVCNAIMFSNTVILIIFRRYFVATYKWGPASFMKLTHFAYRNALKGALRMSQRFGEGQNDAKDMEDFGKLLKGIVHLHNMHQRHEDDVLFPYYDSFFPGFIQEAEEQHEKIHGMVIEMDGIANAIVGGDNNAAKNAQDFLEKYIEFAVEHLKTEELNLINIPQKYTNLKSQKRLIRQTYWMCTRDEWAQFFPFVVHWIDNDVRRVRFLSCFRWALPDEIQRIGMWVYLGVEEREWRRLAVQFPDMIPRGLSGWRRYY